MDEQQSLPEQINNAEQKSKLLKLYQQRTLRIESSISNQLGKDLKQYLQNMTNQSEIKMLEQQISKVSKKLPKEKPVKKSICAKVLKKNQQLIECYDCRNDPTCVICMQCFKNGNHEGHRYVVRSAVGGCCDCGDKEAWKQEGFCKFHNGQFLEFQVDPKHLQIAKQEISKLIYIYFYLRIGKKKQLKQYSQKLIEFLVKLNTNNPYYNKITSIVLTNKLMYKINSSLDNSSVLQNIYKYIISGLILQNWLNLFIIMFSYYPFKVQLIKVYFQRFSYIVDGSEESLAISGSISCQLLTSYQVVDKYCSSNSVGLGQDELGAPALTAQSIKMFGNYYLRLFLDLSYVLKLKGKTPEKYLTMHLKHKKGLQSIFNYYDQVVEFGRRLSEDGMSKTFILITLKQIFYLQKTLIQTFALFLRATGKNKLLLSQTISFLWLKCLEYSDDDEDEVFIFRTYERCLGMCLFFYSDFNYFNIEDTCKRLTSEIINIPYQLFVFKILSILQRVLKTYLMYPRISLESGLSQSLYDFLYFYKIRYHLVSSVDIVTIKCLLTIYKSGLLVSLGVNVAEGIQNNELQKSKLQLNTNLAFISYLYSSYLSEINVACQIFPDSNFYKQETSQFLRKIFVEEKGSISVQKMNLIVQKLFSKQVKYIDEWIKQNTITNKQKKQFVLQKEGINKLGMNYQNIWQNSLRQQNKLPDPFKSKQAVSGSNMLIFQKLWGIRAIQNLAEKVKLLYRSNKEGIEVLLSNVLPIFLIKWSQKMENETKILINEILIPNIKEIAAQITEKLQSMGCLKVHMGQNKMQDQKKMEMDRKKKLMQQKKQKMMQKYKASQQKMLQNQLQQQQLVLKKYSSFSSDKLSDENEEEVCCICRSQNREDFVYLIKMEMRNNQNLLKLGHGVSCLSFYSCFHAFDEKCIQKEFEKSNNQIRCPLCKNLAQTMIPLKKVTQNQKNNHQTVQRIFEVLFNYFEKEEIRSVHEQILKSYYNFMLVCLVDSSNFKGKKCNIYKFILQNLINSMEIKEVQQIEKKIIQNYSKQNKTTSSETKMYEQKLSQASKIQEKQKNSKIRIRKRKNKKKVVEGQKMQEQLNLDQIGIKVEEAISSQLSLFEATMKFIFIYIRAKVQRVDINVEEIQKWKYLIDHSKKIKNFGNFIEAFVKLMFNESLTIEERKQLQNATIFEIKTSPLKQLPKKYIDVGNKNNCSECGEISSQLLICLLCHWVSCQQCTNSNIKTHMKKVHGGGLGVFMNIRTTVAFYFCENGQILEIGQLYENDWGHSPTRTNKWQQFELSVKRLKEIETTLLLDKPLIASKK